MIFVPETDDMPNRLAVLVTYPSAQIIADVPDGWAVFTSTTEYEAWAKERPRGKDRRRLTCRYCGVLFQRPEDQVVSGCCPACYQRFLEMSPPGPSPGGGAPKR